MTGVNCFALRQLIAHEEYPELAAASIKLVYYAQMAVCSRGGQNGGGCIADGISVMGGKKKASISLTHMRDNFSDSVWR